jgi:hypothetical protein
MVTVTITISDDNHPDATPLVVTGTRRTFSPNPRFTAWEANRLATELAPAVASLLGDINDRPANR